MVLLLSILLCATDYAYIMERIGVATGFPPEYDVSGHLKIPSSRQDIFYGTSSI